MSVAHELKQLAPDCEIIYIGDKGDKFGDLTKNNRDIDQLKLIRAGKLRRYHGETMWQHISDWRTLLLNFRDAFYVLAGTLQSFRLLGRVKPDVVFIKGGYVGLPVGMAARLRRVPIITHDSDAIQGLTTKIVGRWAVIHATGMPASYYAYPKDKVVFTGIPIAKQYQLVSPDAQKAAKKLAGVKSDEQLLLISGGGLGSQRVNYHMLAVVPQLLAGNAKLHIIHLAGRDHEAALKQQYEAAVDKASQKRLTVLGFTDKLYDYSAAADLIIARAGATTMAEFAAQGKACVIIPNPLLTGGHQLQNAKAWADKGAVAVFYENQNSQQLITEIDHLLDSKQERQKLASNLAKFAKTDAAKQIAELIIKTAGNVAAKA